MAITSTEQTAIMKTVSALFNKAFTPETTTKFFNFYENNGKDLAAFADGLIGSASYEALYAGAGTPEEFGKILMAKYGMTYGGTSDADTKMTNFIKYSFDHAADNNSLRTIQAVDKFIVATLLPSVTAGNVFETMNTVIENKAEVAIDFKNNPANSGKEYNLSAVTDDDATVTAAKVVANGGTSYDLTAGIDDLTATEFNDIFKATVNNNGTDFTGTLSSLDEIDGGTGIDTLLIQDITTSTNADGINLEDITLTNVEVITIQSANDVENTLGNTLDVSGIAGLTTLNVTKADNVDVKAAATTDVNVSGTSVDIDIAGGKNVVVTDSALDNDITVSNGAATGNAAGTITVTDTKVGTGLITVDGGTDVTVTASGLTDNDTNNTIVIGTNKVATGNVVVTATGADYVAGTASALGDIEVEGGKTITVTQIATSDDSAAAADTSAASITLGDVTVTADATTTEIKVINDTAVDADNAANTTGGATETASVKFADLAATKTVILGGLTLTATVDMTAAEVAAAFANLSADAVVPTTANGDTQGGAIYTKGVFSGSINGWTTGAASGDTVVFTSTTANTDILAASELADTGNGTTDVVITKTDGKAHDATATGGVMGITNAAVNIDATASVTTVTVDGFAGSSSITDDTTNTALATINLSNGDNMTISSAAATLALNLDNVSGEVDVLANTTTINATVNGDATATISSDTAKTLNVTSGNGTFISDASATNELAAATAISTVGFTGTANVTLDGATTTYTGGAGVDNVTVADAGTVIVKAIDLGAGDDKLTLVGNTVDIPTATLKGGDGTDTLSIDATSAAALDGNTDFAAKLNSFERLELTSVGAVNIDVKNLGFANYVTVNGTTAAATLSNLANSATVVVDANVTTSLTVNVEGDTTSTTNVLNVVYTKDGILTGNDLIATNIETVNLTVTDPDDTAIATHTLNFDSAKATSLNIDGNAGLTLTLDTNTVKLVTIDASNMTEGALTVTANGANAMTITGGAGDDILTASTGATAKADVIDGGAGSDVLTAGSNGATLTGGEGNDLFVLTATSASTGTKEATTHSYITDFEAGDLLQLKYFDIDTDNLGPDTSLGQVTIESFAKLAANQSANAVYSDYVDAAMEQMSAMYSAAGSTVAQGAAVWFSFAGNSYIIVDSGAASTGTFTNGEDLAIELTGVTTLANASFNDDFGTISL